MSDIIFMFEGRNLTIQGNINEKMKDIFKRFLTKVQLEENSLYYLCNGNQINQELENIMGTEDKKNNKVQIVVNKLIEERDKNNNTNNIDTIVKSKLVICPECKENIIIKIKDYIISLYGCNKGHNINNLSLDKYEKTQKINLSKLICDKCKTKNKSNTYNNLLYRCIPCEMNLCPLCKEVHEKLSNKTHIIEDYDKKAYLCEKHKEQKDQYFYKYCKNCKKNFCLLCKNEHKKHDTILFDDIEPDIDEKKEELKKLRNLIDNLNNDVQNIIQKLKTIIQNIEIYYNTYNDMIHYYENEIRNYEIIQSLNEMNNDIIIKDIEEINNDKNIFNKFNYLLNYYDKMNKIEINSNKTEIYDNNNNKLKVKFLKEK